MIWQPIMEARIRNSTGKISIMSGIWRQLQELINATGTGYLRAEVKAIKTSPEATDNKKHVILSEKGKRRRTVVGREGRSALNSRPSGATELNSYGYKGIHKTSAYAPNLAVALVLCFGEGKTTGILPVCIPEIDSDYQITDKIV